MSEKRFWPVMMMTLPEKTGWIPLLISVLICYTTIRYDMKR